MIDVQSSKTGRKQMFAGKERQTLLKKSNETMDRRKVKTGGTVDEYISMTVSESQNRFSGKGVHGRS